MMTIKPPPTEPPQKPRTSERVLIVVAIFLAVLALWAEMRITRLSPLSISFLSAQK
jgi:hypothetical protein